MRNPCKQRKLQADKAQCTDTSDRDFFNYYSPQATRKKGEHRMKYKNETQINQMFMSCSSKKNQFLNSNTNNT